MSQIKFGTDGWRAAIAEEFTFHNVRRCARGVAEYLHETGAAERGVVVCHDRRFASEHFAAACIEVLAAHGIRSFTPPDAVPKTTARSLPAASRTATRSPTSSSRSIGPSTASLRPMPRRS